MSQRIPLKSFEFSGINFKTGELDALVQRILGWVEVGSAGDRPISENKLITYINPHVYNLAMHEDTVALCLEKSDCICIDGVGIKIAVLLMRLKSLPRVVAEHLFNALVQRVTQPVTAVLVGVESDEVIAAAKALTHHNANFLIVDTHDGFKPVSTYLQFFKRHFDVQLVLIGAGTPKSEHIALAAMQECERSVIIHIGAGTIKTWAGTKRRGPALMSSLGLEWLHRFAFEPHTRSRYTIGGWMFMCNLISGKVALMSDNLKREHL